MSGHLEGGDGEEAARPTSHPAGRPPDTSEGEGAGPRPPEQDHGGGPPPPARPPAPEDGLGKEPGGGAHHDTASEPGPGAQGGGGTAAVGGAAAAPVRIGRATAVMAVGTTLSRLTGVVRIFALSYALGDISGLADSYNLANTMPNIIHDVVLGGVVSATFIPVFVQRLTTRRDEEAWDAISAVTSVTLLVIAAASIVFLALTPFVIDATTALNHTAQAAQDRRVATELLFLFVPQLAGYGFVSLGTALLNSRHRFGAPMFSSIANNVVVVGILIYYAETVNRASRTVGGLASHRGQLLLLGLGTTAGVLFQAALLVPSLRRAGLRLSWRPDFRAEAVRTIVRLSGWTFGLVVANQLALIVVLALSDRIEGGVSAYTYAWTFFQLPYGVVAVSIMAAIAPELAARWAQGDLEAFRRRMATGLRTTLAIVVPAAAGELILSHPLVALLLGHGATTAAGTVPTATSLAMLMLGLPGFCAFLYAVRVLQSVQNLRAAFWLYVLENAVNVAVAVALAGPLGVRGIALSISIAYTVAAVVALEVVRRAVHGLDGDLVLRPLGRVLLATAALVVGAALGSNLTASETAVGLLLRVVVGAAAGAAAFVLAAGFLARRRSATGPPRRPRPPGPDGRGGRRGPAVPPRPDPLPPAGRPPRRPSTLGPTRRGEPGTGDRGRLG